MDVMDALDKYRKKFGDSFPTMIIRRSNEETIALIERCIQENKTAEELFDIDLSQAIFY